MDSPEKILIFSQIRKKRVLVGELYKSKKKFVFEYDKNYQKSDEAIALGPEFTLWKNRFESTTLFESLLERIPSKNNPAYKNYCKAFNISEKEDDVFILLTTIGSRGPASFIFEAKKDVEFDGKDILSFRESLKLNQNEFELLFDISHSHLVRIENGKIKSQFYQRYFKLFYDVPEALSWILEKRGQYLHDDKLNEIRKKL